jgi:hypothetical protein
MNYKTFFCFLFILISLFSCKNDPLDVSPSDKDLKINYINLDSIFVHTQSENLKNDIEKLNLYPNQILDYQLGHCLGIGKLSDSGTINRIKLFVNDEYVARLENEIGKKVFKSEQKKRKIKSRFYLFESSLPKWKNS